MNRIIFDVAKWSLYLCRAALGLHRADQSDSPERKLEDELFERLFAGEVDMLPNVERDSAYGDWAQRIHDTWTKLPAFDRLKQDCRGRADESALAAEALMKELRTGDKDDELRRSMRTACSRASAAVEEFRDAMEGFDHVAFGSAGPGTGSSGCMTAEGRADVRSLAARLRDNSRLRRIAELAGRFKRIAGGKRRSRVRHGSDEIVDLEQGADLGRLLPLELAQLAHPRTKWLARRNLIERQCQQYRLEGTETLGKGPLIAAIDKSGSMEGERDVWATAVALALLDVAQAERRPFALLCFDSTVKHESIVMPGSPLLETGLFVTADGGTNIEAAVRRSLEIIEEHPGALHQADVVVITDGGSSTDNAKELRDRAAQLGITVLGVAIDVDPRVLEPWCDEVVGAHDMSRVDEKTADALFGR